MRLDKDFEVITAFALCYVAQTVEDEDVIEALEFFGIKVA